ncbi:ABC1 kinase family protein [Pelobacter seleniigenes]|uniref:ABC1 kinase family protein n=1 Tax=Pelobacter seleniigenes TaxID=407188 RepID=UPI000A07AD41|nr:AarF/UbiB family protein [Pelobacter seleniigenes]
MAGLIKLEKRNSWRAAPRLLQILKVLARHKFLGVLRGISYCPSPREVREAFQELGLTYLKLGQVLALRRDLLPDAYIQELELLHDQLPALGIDAIRVTIEAELGAPMAEIFATFNEIPIAAATIAQVHEATLLNGRRVAVKVQRPELDAIIATDMRALTSLVAFGERFYPSLVSFDLPLLVQEFSASLNRETDFRREARSITLFRIALADVTDLWIPKVFRKWSSAKVLTMEFSDGEPVNCYAQKHPDEMPRLINTLVRLMLQTIFEDGLFHADPHPGNVFVLPDGHLSLLDFGMVGELDVAMRESLKLLLEAIVKNDALGAKRAYLEMAPRGREEVNRGALLLDIKAVLQELHRGKLADVCVGDVLDSLIRAGSQHGVHNPGEFFLLTRAFVILEAMIRQLDPKHNYLESFRDQITRLSEQQFSIERIKEKTGTLARDLERLVSEAPGDTRRMLRRIADGDLGRIQTPAMEALGRRVGRNLERLTGAIVSAALIIGGALLVDAPILGWHHYLGEVIIYVGIFGAFLVAVGAWRRDGKQSRGEFKQ